MVLVVSIASFQDSGTSSTDSLTCLILLLPDEFVLLAAPFGLKAGSDAQLGTVPSVGIGSVDFISAHQAQLAKMAVVKSKADLAK